MPINVRSLAPLAGAVLVGLAACIEDSPTEPTSGQTGSAVLTGNITTNRTLSADTVYQLRGIVQVLNGATLRVPAGTRITGSPVSEIENRVSALVVLRGARIEIDGTRDRPVVMTSAGEPGNRFPGDWGGLVVVGNARSNRTGRNTVEGPSPADTIQWTGGTLDADNSGILRYLRIEFAGAAAVLNSELNSLSMYAVGSGTTVEYVQALMGLDDHFEWFGGTVDGRYLVSFEAGDDHFDWAEGYRGRNQFIIGMQTFLTSLRPGATGAVSAEQNGFEADGCGSTSGTCAQGFNSAPYSMPVFANFTMIGPGAGVYTPRSGRDGGLGANLRRGTGGVLVNGVFARYPERAISIFDAETNQRLADDSLDVRNVVFAENAANYDEDNAASPVRYAQASKFAGRGHVIHAGTATSLFVNLQAAGAAPSIGSLDLTPAANSPLATAGLTTFPARIQARVGSYRFGALQGTPYAGAVAPGGGDRWWAGWTSYARN